MNNARKIRVFCILFHSFISKQSEATFAASLRFAFSPHRLFRRFRRRLG